jgi:hypothetical protein
LQLFIFKNKKILWALAGRRNTAKGPHAAHEFDSSAINRRTERAATYYNVTRISTKKIRKESSSRPNEALGTPGKKRKWGDTGEAIVDNFDRRVIRDTIQDFYVRQRTVPTCRKLPPVLREKINFQCSERPLRKVLKEMGFKWKKCGTKTWILIERADIVYWRFSIFCPLKILRRRQRNFLPGRNVGRFVPHI